MRILVVEDDTPLATFVRKGLEAEHYAVDTAGDGELARCMALESDYDLLVLDLNLPKLDGLEVLRALRAKKPSLPVLVLTARNRSEDRVQSLDSGADDCLNKPFSLPSCRLGFGRCCDEVPVPWIRCCRWPTLNWIAWNAR